MRELTEQEVMQVGGGQAPQISGYQGAGAVGSVLALGAAAGPLGPVVLGIGFGSMFGLASAQFLANYKMR